VRRAHSTEGWGALGEKKRLSRGQDLGGTGREGPTLDC